MLPTRAALQEAARQEALEQERARMAAFLDDSAAVVQPAHAPWTVPCNLELEVQPRASFSEIEEELRHLELDLVEAIEGYKEHVHELHFWRFGPQEEVQAERRLIAEMLQEEQAHRPHSGARGPLGELGDDDGENKIRDGMKRCRRRLQLELRVAELELQLRLQTHRGTNEADILQERGQRGACIPGPLNIERDRLQKDWNCVHAGCLETSEAPDGDGRPAILGQAIAAVSVLPDGFMKELESTINALHAELEGRDREVQRLQLLVDDYGRNLLSNQSDLEPRSSLKRRNKLLRGSVASWRNRVLRHRNAIHCEDRLALTQKTRIVRAWHNHVLMQDALRKIRLDDGITLKGSVMNRLRSLLEVWRRIRLQRVLQMWVAQPGLRGSKLAIKLMRRRLRHMIHMWISGACMRQERQIRIAQCQNKAARRTVIQILRFWRAVVDKGGSLAHCHNRFASRSSTKQIRSYFLVWFYRNMHMKFNRLNILRLQVRSRRRRLKAIVFGWSLMRSRAQFQRRAVVRIQLKSSFRGMSTAMQSWRREYMNRQSKAKRAALRQYIWQTRNIFAFWSEFVRLAQAKRRLNIDDGLFIRGSLENRLRLHLRATRRRHLIQLILTKWASFPALCCRGFARKAIKNRLKSILVLWIRRVFFFQNRQLCVVRFQRKTSRKKLNRTLQAWSNAVDDAKRLARQHSLIHLRSSYRTLSNVMQSWRPAVHYLIAAQQYLRLASEMGKGTGSATARRSSRDGKTAVMYLAEWREVAGSSRLLRERSKRTMARRKKANSSEFFHRWAQKWGSRRRQVQNAVACLKMALRSHTKHKKDVLRTLACFVQVQMQMRVAMVRVERKYRLLLLMGIMATWVDVGKKALQERRRLLKKHVRIGAGLSMCHQDDDSFHFACRRIFELWRKRISFKEHIHKSILKRKLAQRINSMLRVWKELCMYVSWKRTMASLVIRALKASHMRRKRLVFSWWVHEYARIKQDRTCSDLVSRTLYANSKSLNAVTGLTRSSVFFSWSSHAVQMNKVRRHTKRMLLKLRFCTLSNVMQSWRPAVHYLIAAQQYLRLASEMGKGTGSATARRSSRDGKTAVMYLAEWREVAGSSRLLRERSKRTMARRKKANSSEFFHRWAQKWGSRRRQVQNAVACLKMALRSHTKHKKDVLRTLACFVQVQMQMRVAMVRVERKYRLLLLMGIMATWVDVGKKALQERRRLLKKHVRIGAGLSMCHQDDDSFHFACRRIFELWRKRISFKEHIHKSILKRKLAQRINSMLRVWKELCMYVSWKRTMASLVIRALKASHMRRKRLVFSWWVHEYARIKQDRTCSDLVSRTLYANSKSLNAVTGLTRSSVFFSWSSHAVQMNKVRRHTKRMLLKLRFCTLSNVMQSWRPAVHYLIAAQQYLRLASEMGKGTGSATARRSSRDGKTAVMYLAEWREVAGSSRLLRERSKRTMARRKKANSSEFFHRWAQKWGSRRRQVQNAVACLKMALRSHTKHKKDVLRTLACFVQVQMQMRVAMVRVERKYRLLLLMGIMATWVDVGKKALQERRRLLKKHVRIGAGLSMCHQDDDSFHFACRRIFELWRKRISFKEHIHKSILKRKLAQRINSMLRVWKELCMYVSWKRTMASLVIRALKASHMRRKRLVFSWWVHEYARIKQDRTCSDLVSRTLYANSKSLNAVTGLTRSSVFFSWSSHAVQMNKVRRHTKRMLLKLRFCTLSNVMQSWRPAVHYLIAAQQYLRLASEMGKGTGSATARRSSRDGKTAVMYLAEWREVAGSSRLLRERSKRTMARRKKANSSEFFHRWAQKWGSRRRQVQNAVACLKMALRSHTKHKKDVLRTLACFVQVQMQMRVAMVRVERKYRLLLLMGIMATWVDVGKKALQERRRLLKKHVRIGAGLSMCHQDDDSFHFACRRIFELWRKRISKGAGSKMVLRSQRLGMLRGFIAWSEYVARQRRIASAAVKIVMRGIKLALSPAVSRWMAYVEEKKRLVRATDKAMLRWQNMCLALAWARWKERTAEQRRLRMAGSKVVKRWTHKSQALAWGMWWEELRRSRVMKKAAVRWTQKILCAAWSTWAETCTESLWLRAISWKAWRDGQRRLMMRRGVSQRVGLRIRNRLLKTVWSVWLKRSCAWKELNRLRGKMLNANFFSLLMNSFWGWIWLFWRQRKLTRCLKKMRNRDVCEKLTRVLSAWRATAVIRHVVHSRTNRKAIRLCRIAFIGWRDSVLYIYSNDIFVRQVIRRRIFAVCERFLVSWCRLYRLAKRIRGAVQRAVEKKLYHNAVQFFIVWRGRVFNKRLQLRVERVFVRKKTRQAVCLVMAAWLEMCENQQSSGPFAITAVKNTAVDPKNSDSQPQVPRAIKKWSEGMMKMVNIHEMRQQNILKMWRSLKDEKDTSDDVISRFGLMLLAKTLILWRSLCSSRKLYRKSSVCAFETVACHLALTGLHSMKRFLLVWFALTHYQGSKRRFVKWVQWRPHRKRTESYFWLWASTCFRAKMLEQRVTKVCLRRGDMIRSRKQILHLFIRWRVAAHVMRSEKKRQRIIHTRCKRLCRIKTLNVLCEWRSAILDSRRKKRQIFNSQRSLARTQIFKTVTHWSSIALFDISHRRRVSKAKRALQLVRISKLFQQWVSFTLRDHETRRLVSITKNRIGSSRTTNLVALLFSSWLGIIIQRKLRERKVARKIFRKANFVKRFVWHRFHSFCTGAKVTRKRLHARISRIRYRLVQKIFLVFVEFHKALLRAQHVRNEKCIAKNAVAWISHVRCQKWRQCVGNICSRRKTYRLLDSCFARWVNSLNAAHQNAELDALSASQWRMRIRARAFDQWRRSVELNIRWHAYLFSQIVPSYSSRCSRWTAIVSCFRTLKCWTLKRRHFRLLGRICSKTRRSSEMKKCRQSIHRLSSYCKIRRNLKRMVLCFRNRGIFKTYATWADNAREVRRQKGVMERMALRMRNACILKTYARWADNARELDRQRSVLEWMALRIRKARMFKAWFSWRKYASSRQRKRRLLLKASKFADLNTAVFLDLVLDMHMSEIAGNEQYFKDFIVRDVADSIGGHADLIKCVALEAGSIIVHLKLEEGVCGLKRRALDVAKELMSQAAVPSSKLKGGHYTCTAKDVRVVSSSAAVQRNVFFRILKLRVLQSWRTYVDHKSSNRIFIQQKKARALFQLSHSAFAGWRTVQKEGRIQQLLLKIESIQLLHDRKSNALNENVTKMCDSIESRLHALLQNQEQVLLGAVSLKQRCEIQHGEIARMLEKMSRVESERRVELESARNERQGDIERIESELRSERTLLVAEFCDEKQRLMEHRQKSIRLVAEIQQRTKRRHRMQQIVSNWHHWASYRQARALGHERVCARFQRQQAKGQKQRILDALSMGKISRLEMELDDVKSSFLCVQTRISSLKAQVSIKQAEPDGESNPERLRFEHEKIDLQGDATEDGTLETLASDSQHNLEEITLYLSHLRSLNTSLQDRINQQNFKLIEMHQKVQEASTLQAVHTFNENLTKMCDSIESRLHALLQNQEQVLLGAVSLKQRCEIQHGEIARMLEKISRVESERRVELESARNERQGDIERIESELRRERTLLVAEFCDEKQRLKEHRIYVFEERKGRERFLCMQEQAFSWLSYYTRQQSKLFRFEGWRRLRCLAQALHTFAFLSKQRHQEEMLEQRDSVVDVIREAVNEASRIGRNLLEDRPQDSDTPRRKYQEIVPLPPREGRGMHLSGRRFFVREVEQSRAEEPRPYHDVVNSVRNLSLMIHEVSERNRAGMESRRSHDTAYTVLRQKSTRLVAEIQQRTKRRHRMQQIVSNWHHWASYRQARALGHERVCARFQRQQAKGQKQRILDALSMGKISRLEMELDDVKSSFLCVQTRISSLKAQVSIKQAEPDGESNPERLRFEHEKIDLQGDATEDGTLETLASDSQHNLEEITLYLSHLRSLNTSLQDRINQQNFKLIEMHQKVQEASTLQAVHTFNENVTKMCDSIESRLHALLQNQEQVLLGAVSLKQRCEIQHGEIARMLEKMSRVESERRVELESARNERQGDIERIESELRSERTLLVAEFCDEKQRLKEHRIYVFEERKGRERFLCMQEQAFSWLSYYTRQQSKLFRFEGWRRLRCLAQALHTFAFLSKQRHQEEMLEQRDSVVDVIREAVNEASRIGRNLLEDRPQDSDTPRRKYQEIVPLPPREGRGLHLSGRRFFVREVEQSRAEEPRPYHDVVNSVRNLSLMIHEVSERNRAGMESRRSHDTAYTVLRQKSTRLVAEIQQRSKRRHRMQQIVSNWHHWASYRQARALGHERVCARFQRQQAKDQETRAWQAFAEFCFHAKLQRADDVLVELRQQKQILLRAHDKHVVELQARDTRILILEETALSQTKLIEDVRRSYEHARDVGTAHDKVVIELQECKEVSTRQTHLIADLQRQIEDAQKFDESQSQSIQNLEQVSASLAQVIEILNRQFQGAHEVRGKEHDELQDKLEGTSRELQHALSANANLWGIEVKLKAENSALKNECTRLRSYENSIATIRVRVDDLQTREDDACKQILSMQTTQRALEGKLAASQKSLLQAQQMLQQSEDAARTIAAEKIELEVVVKTLTASLLAFQSTCHESMEKLRFHNADLSERLVATELLAQTLFCDLDAVRMDLYHFTTYETDAAKLEEENNDLRSSIDAMNGTMKDLNIATIDKALRRSLEQFLYVRGRVMTLEAEKQTLKRECIRLRSTESILSTFRSRVTEMQSREEAGQRTLLSLQAEKRNAERRLAEANESIRKSDNMLKHLTQDKVDLESELEALRIVNANLRHELVRNKLLHTEEHFSTLQSPHENVVDSKSTLPDALSVTVKEKSTLPDDEIRHDKAGDEVVDEAVFPYSRQSDIDRGKMLIAVGELRNSLSARATRSRPCTPRLRPASLEAAPEAEGARVAGQEDVEKDKKRAIQAAIKLRASLSSQ